jgi:polysaccharide biosynthesis/export protein
MLRLCQNLLWGSDMKLVRVFLCFIVALALQACMRHGNHRVNSNDNFATSSIQPLDKAGGIAAIIASTSDYRIASLDVLDVTVLGVPDLSRTVQVSSEGFISLPLIKTISAAGLTAHEIENQIAAKLAATYMQSPQVSVFIKEFNSQRITVDGAVVKPGIYPFTGKLTLLQAIALSQGLTQVADTKGVLVFRNSGDQTQVARFDISKIRKGQARNPMLQAGDIVTVDESTSRTTLRAIKDVVPLTGLFQLFNL